MIYLKQDFNIDPASPATRDAFVELAEDELVPGLAAGGGRLMGAWFNHAEWFSQLTHVVEFDDLGAYDAYRKDAGRAEQQRRVEELAPERHESLWEPLGPVAPSRLHEEIEAAKEHPEGAHTFAILQVNPGCMERFQGMLKAAAAGLPIVASWRPVAGNPNEVIDLWKGDNIGRDRYRPNSDGMAAFFGPLRELAPRERMVSLFPLPYSPLR